MACILLSGSHTANAWTSAHLFNVDVSVHVASEAESIVTTDARFVVEAGHFHGFDLMRMPGAELDKRASFAFRDDGRRYNLKFKKIRGGRIRVVLADEEEVQRGGITFQLVHRTDLIATGALRSHEGRARLDWTPIIWDEGLDNMTVYLQLPDNGPGQIEVDPEVTRDYVVEVGETHINLIKYRPVRWYPMNLVVDFNPKLVPGLSIPTSEASPEEPHVTTAAISGEPTSGAPSTILPPLGVVLFGILLLIVKFHHVRRAYAHLGMTARPALLSRTSLPVRIVLAITAGAVGLWVQNKGHLAAGIPVMTITAALFILRRQSVPLKPRAGGSWRRMSDDDIERFKKLAARYRRRRISFVDITAIRGMVSFTGFIGALAYGAYTLRNVDAGLVWTTVIDGLILAIPAWFGSIRSEMPVDATLEGYHILRRWRKSLSRLLGEKTPGAAAEFWIREDEEGPIEIRLRASVPIENVNNLEVAGETVRVGSTYKTKTVFVFRMAPGTPAARRLATCDHAAEHHLTPDLQEEIIVLRNRRGRVTSGLRPLRAALSMLATSPLA